MVVLVALTLPAIGSCIGNLELSQWGVGKEELGEGKAERKGKALNFFLFTFTTFLHI